MAHEQYIKHTDGNTAVLFIHGFLGSPEHFAEYIKRVPQNVAVYNILLKGHGGTTKDFSAASMDQWKKQVDDAADEILLKYNNVIICGHSMGTFFAMEQAIRHKEKVKSLFLLAVPFRIAVRPTAFLNTAKAFFGIVSDTDEVGKAYNNAHSVKLTKRVWQYIGWIPRYLELFRESKAARETAKNVAVPCRMFFSKKDELVSVRSASDVPGRENISHEFIDDSAHFIYGKNDMEYLLCEFEKSFDDIKKEY